MLATKDFVLLNMPKTGSSFARSVIKKAYRARATRSPLSRVAKLWGASQLFDPLEEILVAPLDPGLRSGLSQHGTIEQIPYRHRAKSIISVTRHPLARLVSAYRFKDWARFPPAPVTQLEAEFPSWPNLSVEEWYDMVNRFSLKIAYGAIRSKLIWVFFRCNLFKCTAGHRWNYSLIPLKRTLIQVYWLL